MSLCVCACVWVCMCVGGITYQITCFGLDRRRDTHAHATNSFGFVPPIAVGDDRRCFLPSMNVDFIPNLINHQVIATIHFVREMSRVSARTGASEYHVYVCVHVCVACVCTVRAYARVCVNSPSRLRFTTSCNVCALYINERCASLI